MVDLEQSLFILRHTQLKLQSIWMHFVNQCTFTYCILISFLRPTV